MNTAPLHSSPHPLDAATRLETLEPGRYRGHTSAHYANMVGPFGGILAATLLNAIWLHPERLGDPVALTVNFAGPVADGEFLISARVLRTNRSTQHWYLELTQGDQLGVSATAVFATRRDTWSATETRFPATMAAADLERTPPIEHAKWTAAYDMRFVHGAPAWTPNPASTEQLDSVSTLWLRDEPPRPLDFMALTAICDAFFPRLFTRRPRWVPIGTVSLTIYFHADSDTLQQVGQRAVLGTARALHFGKGYFDQTAEVWSEQQSLLATTHQVVYFKE